MPWYSFTAVWPDNNRSGEAGATRLSDHEQAQRYAHILIRELKEHPDYRDPGLKMVVRDGDGDVIHIIPF